ncbi:MAG: DHH family phosphoesterase [Planctomycetota bacterium]
MPSAPYQSNTTLPQLADTLRATDGPILVLTHAKPDGDALGCVLALTLTLRQLGKTAKGLVVPPVPDPLRSLAGRDAYAILGEDPLDEPVFTEPQRVVIVDTGAVSQVGDAYPVIEPHLDKACILDHHLSGNIPAERLYVDTSAAAAAEVIAELIDLLHNRPPNAGGRASDAFEPAVADALFVGIASDTGWFRFSNTTARTHRLAARLVGQGVDHAALYAQLEQAERPEKLELLGRALASLRMLADGQAAVMALTLDDFAETGAREEETERLIDTPQQVSSLRVVVLLAEKQTDNGVITRMSFRSKPTEDAVNVAELAAQFSGGGHARAAGARANGTIAEVLPRVTQAIEQAMTATA